MQRLTEAIVLTILLACIPTLAQVQPLINPIQRVVDAGLMSPADDGQFYAEATVSRAELARILVKTFELNHRSDLMVVPSHPIPMMDVPVTHWAYSDIQMVLHTGLMTAFSGDRFLPNQPVSRVEGFAAIAQASQLPQPNQKQIAEILRRHPDAEAVPDWAKQTMAIALSHGLINTDNTNRIEPQQLMTRGDIALTLSVYISHNQPRQRGWRRSINSQQLQPKFSAFVHPLINRS
ncbi:MAG: S-layer homology domain-containing protein [Kaiparowitsia implicata GSE-PSE-MK54-09C]|jgi:hypothetical protein|nr:S-layer homology domain-containing protein [Kaiparowitsia implicata GSE-PSE-MK54-09C]